MTLLWPDWLWTLLLLPLLVLLYLRLLARRKKNNVRLASVAIVRQALGKGPGWRRHVPPLLLLTALALLLLATARPVVKLKLPARDQTIILAMDVSGSMRATDVKPNRMVAAQEAAKAFVAGLPRSVRVGVVALPAPLPWCRRPPSAVKTWWPRSTASRCSAPPPSARG